MTTGQDQAAGCTVMGMDDIDELRRTLNDLLARANTAPASALRPLYLQLAPLMGRLQGGCW